MNDCNKCRYIQNLDNPGLQTCSKWVDSSNFDVLCTEGGNPGDPPPNIPSSNCQPLECPSHCQYPFTKDVYTEGVIPDNYYDMVNQSFPSYRFLNENTTDLESYVTSSTDRTNIKRSV